MDSKLMIALAVTVICTSPMHAADETETTRPWLAEPVNPLSKAVDPSQDHRKRNSAASRCHRAADATVLSASGTCRRCCHR